jgi:hypothetical protein
MSGVAYADIILIGGTPTASFIALAGNGFGNAPRLLTLQEQNSESGYVIPVNQEFGNAKSGANKSSTPTLEGLGWASGSLVGIGFNTTNTTGITLDTLVLTIYNGDAPVGSFSLKNAINFSKEDLKLQTGNGNAVFNFGLDADQQGDFNTILGMIGSSGFYAGLSSSLSQSDGGPDSFLGFAQSAGVPVPDGGSVAMLLGMALMGLAGVRRMLK